MADTSPGSLRRTRIDPALIPEGAVLIDQLRERTRWSEGMFVTSQHFNRDQSYLITRAGDLGQAIGPGVIEGLEVVAPVDDPTAVIVSPGIGIAGGGDSVVVHQSVRIPLGDIALQKSLSQATRIEETLQLTAESRSGLFALCATPVEFSSNPVGSYATTPGGKRKLEDSVTNEATLFTLVPYSLGGTTTSAEARRAMAARRIFIDGHGPDIPPTSLPLAMMEVEGNVLVWLDIHLMRRRAGASRADAFGLGFVNTPARLAHYRQYDELITEMVSASPGLAFAASDRFEVLPPMGRMPASCVTPRAPAPGLDPVLSHNWLPAEMPVELVALPEDEIDQLLEESLTLPPIDLSAKPEALAQTPVSIIIPIPRLEWAQAPTEVMQQALSLVAAKPLGGTPQTPMALIRSLLEQERDEDLIDPTASAEWLALLSGRSLLWYARRRQFLRTDALTGEAFRYQIDPPDEDGDSGEAPPIEDPAPYLDAFDEAVRAGLAPWGMSTAFARLSPGNDADTRPIKADLNGALGVAIGGGSPLAAADILHRFRDDPRAETVRELRRFYTELQLHQTLTPQEGLLLGGVIDIVIPPFTGKVSTTNVNDRMARAVNFGTRSEPAETLALPDGFTDRIERLIERSTFSTQELAAIQNRGGGAFNLDNPRDLGALRDFMSFSRERNVPLIWQVRDPGSVEAQTRRNLVAGTLSVSRIAGALREIPLVRVPDAVLSLLATLNDAITSNAGTARRRVNSAVRDLLSELRL